MSAEIQVSEKWMDGFVKTAEAAGVNADDIPRLLKLSCVLAVRKANPKNFDAGYNETMKAAQAQPVSQPPPADPRKWWEKLPVFGTIASKLNRNRLWDDASETTRRVTDLQAQQRVLSSVPGVGGGTGGFQPYGYLGRNF